MLRRLDVPRRDPTATIALALLARQRERPRLPTLRRHRREPLRATIAECLAAKRARAA